MNNRAKLARLSAWCAFEAAAASAMGRGSALHRAAIAAAFGRDPGGGKFARLVARLEPEDQRRLYDTIERLDTERAEARSA